MRARLLALADWGRFQGQKRAFPIRFGEVGPVLLCGTARDHQKIKLAGIGSGTVQRAGPSHTLDLKSPFHPARAEITTSAMHKQAPVKAAIMSFWASHSSPCVPR